MRNFSSDALPCLRIWPHYDIWLLLVIHDRRYGPTDFKTINKTEAEAGVLS